MCLTVNKMSVKKVIEFKFDPGTSRPVEPTRHKITRDRFFETNQPFIEVINANGNKNAGMEFKFSNDGNAPPRPGSNGTNPAVLPKPSTAGSIVAKKIPRELALVFGDDAQDEKPKIRNDQSSCSLCAKKVNKDLSYNLKKCQHSFCMKCLVFHMKNTLSDTGHIRCPSSQCRCDIGDDDAAKILGGDFSEFVKRMKDAVAARKKQEIVYRMIEEDADFIENVEVFECSVCGDDIDINSGLILKECLHTFCKEDLIGQIKSSDDFEVKCLEVGCKNFITELEVRSLLSAGEFDKHHEKSLRRYKGKHAKELKQCLKPDCIGVIEADENVLKFDCPACATVNCLKCKAIHTGKSCQQYQSAKSSDDKRQQENAESENTIKILVDKNEAMYCPQCGIPVMKDEGCDYITCSTCDLGICWRTKKPRLPITLPDGKVVDGCHCKVNGEKCHPDCRNCH